MTDNSEWLNRRARDAELINPLAEELWTRHEGQVSEVEEYLGGIGWFGEPSGVVYQCKPGEPNKRPATDEECRMINIEWDTELSINLTGDIPAQVSDQLAKLARRLMRAAKRIRLAQSAGEFSLEGDERVFHVVKDGEIIGTFSTQSAAVTYAMRTDGRWYEKNDGESDE